MADPHHHGLRYKMELDLSELMKDQELMETYGISSEHLRGFQDFADNFGNAIDEWMVKMKQTAQGIGTPLRTSLRTPLREPVPYLLSQMASKAGVPADAVGDISSILRMPITRSSKIENPYLQARSRVERFSYLRWRILESRSAIPSGPNRLESPSRC